MFKAQQPGHSGEVALSSATVGCSTAGHILVYVLITYEIMDVKCQAEGNHLIKSANVIIISRDSLSEF